MVHKRKVRSESRTSRSVSQTCHASQAPHSVSRVSQLHKRRTSYASRGANYRIRVVLVCLLFVCAGVLSAVSVYALIPEDVQGVAKESIEKHEDYDEDLAQDSQSLNRGDLLGDQSVAKGNAEAVSAIDFTGWNIGIASAYSLESADNWSLTASGIPLDNYSYTVAVPAEKSSLLGSRVEIGYDNLSVDALITDTGGFGPLGRDFDLSPAIWHRFGADTEEEWGIRSIYYRFEE